MADIKIGRMTLGACATNCYFLYREGSSDVVLIDPADRGAELYEALKQKGLLVKEILLTHGHFDHIYGGQKMREVSGAKIYASAPEKVVCQDAHVNVSANFGRKCTLIPDEWLTDGRELELCGMKIKVIVTPGHTIGSTCYYLEEAGILVSGDTLFESSVGRTDFPTGSMNKLIASIKEKLFVLPDETKVYPGHGNITTIGAEKKFNPFIQ